MLIHNHPSNIPIPSGMSNKSGDIPYSIKMNKIFHTNHIQYQVYSAKYHLYVPYSANSTPEDFLPVLSFIQWLDPSIIELLKR